MGYNVDWFFGKRVTVMGLGLHGGGLGVAKWLLKHGANLIVTDMKSRKELAKSIEALEAERTGDKKVRYVLGHHNESDFVRTDMVIRNPAVPQDHPLLRKATAAGIPVESDISLFFMLCPFPITAVTGTKGKTTTTVLLSEICRSHDRRTVVGGNIRISSMDSLDRLLSLSKRKSVAAPPIILELSSWQLESLERHRLSPHVAVITNVMRDHLDRYGGRIAGYAAAKELAVRFQDSTGIAVLNADDTRVEAMARRIEKRSDSPNVIRFSSVTVPDGDAAYLDEGKVIVSESGRKRTVMPVRSIRVAGGHNLGNVLAAVAAARAMKIPMRTIAASVRAFRGVSGRLEQVTVKGGISYVNDTTATMPEASRAAVMALAGPESELKRVILIAGGKDKDLVFGDWAKTVATSVKGLVLFDGTATPKMEKALKNAKAGMPWVKVRSMKDAVDAARAVAVSGDVILLSPGCASFGLFANEFDRGDQFVDEVLK